MTSNSNSNVRPIIVFSKTSRERDFWRNILMQKNATVLFFEKETIFFDNLKSLNARAIILVTDSHILVWRFVFALNASNADARLIIISNMMTDNLFQLYGLSVSVLCFSDASHSSGLCPTLWEAIDAKQDAVPRIARDLFVGLSPVIKGINTALPDLVKNCNPVLITGEVGTGKELLARMIAKPAYTDSILIKVSCTDLSRPAAGNGNGPAHVSADNPGLLRSLEALIAGNTATVLLDNIDKLDLQAQSEMLHFLDKNYDSNDGRIRVLATSRRDLAELVERNRFRKDLYYRLNVIPLYLPPLRQRRQDIPLLMDHFAIGECARLGRSFLMPSEQVTGRLFAYPWPGNLKELRRAMLRFALSGDETQLFKQTGIPLPGKTAAEYLALKVEMESLLDPVCIQSCLPVLGSKSLKSISDQFVYKTEKKLLRKALESTNWNRKKAAALLSISYKSILNKMKHYELI